MIPHLDLNQVILGEKAFNIHRHPTYPHEWTGTDVVM